MMEASRSLLIFAMSFALASPLCLAADDEPAVVEAERVKEAQQAEQETNNLPSESVAHVADVAHFQIDNGRLSLQTRVRPTGGQKRMRIADLPDISILDIRGRTPESGLWTPAVFTLIMRNFSKPRRDMGTNISLIGNRLMISRDSEEMGRICSVSLIQSNDAHDSGPGVSFNVQCTPAGDNPEPFRFATSARDFLALRRMYPQQTSQYLEPIFRDLHQESVVFAIDPALAWQVFADSVEPDPSLIEKIQKLIPRLDSDAPADRDAASDDLAKLGQPAAIWLMRMDRKKLSPEQRSRIDAFLADFRTMDDAQAKKLQTDRGFLLDCLFSDNEAIRQKALTNLRKVTTHPVKFGPKLNEQQRSERIAQLRAELLGPPTTQPLQPAK